MLRWLKVTAQPKILHSIATSTNYKVRIQRLTSTIHLGKSPCLKSLTFKHISMRFKCMVIKLDFDLKFISNREGDRCL